MGDVCGPMALRKATVALPKALLYSANAPFVPTCPAQFMPFIDTDDSYVMDCEAYKSSREHKTVLLITTKYLYKLSLEHELHWRRNLLELHVIEHKGGTDVFIGYKSKIIGQEDTMGADALPYHMESADIAKDVYTILTIAARDAWQIALESLCIPPPEVYQTHEIVGKYNKRNVIQQRCLAISDKQFYNIELDGFLPSRVKWSVRIEDLCKVSVYKDDPECLLITHQSTVTVISWRKKEKTVKQDVFFRFNREANKHKIIASLRLLFYAETGRELPVEICETNDAFE